MNFLELSPDLDLDLSLPPSVSMNAAIAGTTNTSLENPPQDLTKARQTYHLLHVQQMRQMQMQMMRPGQTQYQNRGYPGYPKMAVQGVQSRMQMPGGMTPMNSNMGQPSAPSSMANMAAAGMGMGLQMPNMGLQMPRMVGSMPAGSTGSPGNGAGPPTPNSASSMPGSQVQGMPINMKLPQSQMMRQANLQAKLQASMPNMPNIQPVTGLLPMQQISPGVLPHMRLPAVKSPQNKSKITQPPSRAPSLVLAHSRRLPPVSPQKLESLPAGLEAQSALDSDTRLGNPTNSLIFKKYLSQTAKMHLMGFFEHLSQEKSTSMLWERIVSQYFSPDATLKAGDAGESNFIPYTLMARFFEIMTTENVQTIDLKINKTEPKFAEDKPIGQEIILEAPGEIYSKFADGSMAAKKCQVLVRMVCGGIKNEDSASVALALASISEESIKIEYLDIRVLGVSRFTPVPVGAGNSRASKANELGLQESASKLVSVMNVMGALRPLMEFQREERLALPAACFEEFFERR